MNNFNNFNDVNSFFANKVYKNLIDFGLAPISWAFSDLPNNQSYTKKALLWAFAPVFFSLAAITIELTASVVFPAFIIHLIAATVAFLSDILNDNGPQRQYQPT